MKKIITLAAATMAGLALAAPAQVAQADNDSNFGPGVNAANNWSFTAADVCMQELAVVPALVPQAAGPVANACSNGNVIDHALH